MSAEPSVIHHPCDQCGVNPATGRFCCDKCRAMWHREHDPRGMVRSVRRLANGGTAVTIHFGPAEAERALRFAPKQRAVLGEIVE